MFDVLSRYNDGDLLFLGSWGPPWLILFSALAVTIVVLTWLDLDAMSRRRRLVITGLRALTLSLAIVLLLEPALELKNITKVPNHVAVLVDTSESMTLPTEDGEPRYERVEQLSEEIVDWSQEVEDTHRVDFFQFSDALTSTDAASFVGGASYAGVHTDLEAALQSVRDNYRPDELGGVVIISDGTDNQSMASRVPRGEPLDSQTTALIEDIPAPVSTFSVAKADELRDLSVKTIHHDDFAFVRNTTTVDVVLRSPGIGEATVPVTLYRDGSPLQSREVKLAEGKNTHTVTFELVPELLGKELYTVRVPVLEGEVLSENNIDHFILRVIRDKIRVLQVVGWPSWDVRFLRQLLKNNPNVELISFFILRTNEDVQRAPANEMALIPFPTRELFEEQLGSFDLVVLQNFTFVPYRMRQYLPNIRSYVQGGGGLLMVGGEQSFASGGYANTPVAEVLPVNLPSGSSPDALIDRRKFSLQLTAAGQRHPITRLAFDREANRSQWEELPKMPGTNIVLSARPQATTLATHPVLRGEDGEPMPVMSVMDVDEGRSMAMTVDGSWLWNYANILTGGSSHTYASFWNNAIRWLIRDPALKLVDVEISKTTVQPGRSVDVDIRVFRPDYRPATNIEGELRIFFKNLNPDKESKPDQALDILPFTTNDRGRATLSVPIEKVGGYRLHAQAEVEEGNRHEDDEILLALNRTQEVRDIQPRPELLEQIADASGGQSYHASDGWTPPPLRESQAEVVHERHIISIWSSPWLLLVFVLLLGVEWQLRRSWGRL